MKNEIYSKYKVLFVALGIFLTLFCIWEGFCIYKYRSLVSDATEYQQSGVYSKSGDYLNEANSYTRKSLSLYLFKRDSITLMINRNSDLLEEKKNVASDQNTPSFSMTIKSYKLETSDNVIINGNLKNISGEPFLTKFAFDDCQIRDKTGKDYKISLMGTYQFTKALKPSASSDFKVKDFRINLGGEGIEFLGSNKYKLCDYNDSGVYKCSQVEFTNILKCNVQISIDSTLPGNGWGKYSGEVVFPN